VVATMAEGNLPQQECHPVTSAIEKDDLVIPVSRRLPGALWECSMGAIFVKQCLLTPTDHRLRPLSEWHPRG
jgi:hypothetical protein